MKLTEHAANDRMDRLLYISKYVGFGDICFEWYDESCQRWHCITTTGVIYIKDKNKQVLITAYVVQMEKAQVLFRKAHKTMPSWLKARIIKNKVHIQRQNQSKGY